MLYTDLYCKLTEKLGGNVQGIFLSITIKIKGDNGQEIAKSTAQVRIPTRVRRGLQAAKSYGMEHIVALVERYEAYFNTKKQEWSKQWPPHSLFCEKRCCQRAITSYYRFLKKELVWSKDGHLI